MFDTMRKHSQSFIIYVLFAAIIAVFVISFGPGGGGCNTEIPFAAKVNGETISEDDFNRVYSDQVRNVTTQNPGLDMKLLKQFNLKRQVLDQLIDGRLLKQSAEKAGLAVSEEELRQFIYKVPAFQVAGKFDYTAYERYVNYSAGTSPARFEIELRDQLLSGKYRDVVETTAAIPDAELWEQYQADNDKVDLYFVSFKDADITAAPPTPEAIATFAKAHEAEVKERYARDGAKYHEPQKWKARHILIKLQEKASDAEVAKAKAQIEKIAGEAKTEDFAALAKKYSEDSSKDKGGDLGYFSSGMMVKPFEDAVKEMKPGEISKPVRSPFGFHLIKLEEVKEGTNHPIEEVKNQIASEVLIEQGRKSMNEKRASDFLAQLSAGKSITDVAQADAEDAADKDKKDDKKKTAKVDTRPVYKTTGLFAHTTVAVPKIGVAEGLVKDAFTLGDNKKVLAKPYRSGDRFVVVALKERMTPDKAKFESEHTHLREAAIGKKRSEIVRGYLASRRAKSDIKVNDRLISYDVDATPAAAD